MKHLISLSERERRFIVATAMNASLSVKETADLVGAREHLIRHTRDSLLSRGIIKPLHKIDIYRLGYTDFRAYLSDIAEPTKSRIAFEKRVLQYPQVYWFSKMNGAFQYAITFLARESYEMIEFSAATQPPDTSFYAQKSISIAGDWSIFAPTYLTPEVKRKDSITLTARNRIEGLDDTDHLILSAMAKNPSSTAASLTRLLGMKGSSLQYRIDKLTEMGVLRGQIYLIQCDLLGILVYRVLLRERGLSASERERLRKYCSSHSNVVAFHQCTGGWDYEIRFETFEAQTLEDFCQNIIDNFGAAIGSITTSQQVSVLKRVSYPC